MISPLVVDQRGEEERGAPRSGRQGATNIWKRGAEDVQIMGLKLK